jgi:exonuclease SbcC
MRALHLRLKGVTRYTAELDLDLRQVEPGIVAVVGPNGAGKSTLIECMAPLPLFLELPSYHPTKLAESFQRHVRDGFVETTLEWGGHEYRHVVQVDPQKDGGRGKVEAFLYRDGQPVPEWETPGRQKDYLAAMGALYPPREVFLAAAFSVQTGRGNWFELERAERRDLFAQLLGQGRLQQLAERAARHRKGCDAAAADLDAEAERLAAARASFEELTGRRVPLVTDRDQAQAAVDDGAPVLVAAVEAASTAKAEHDQLAAAAAELRRRREELATRRDQAEVRRAAKWSELDRLLEALDGREEIEAGAAEHAELTRGRHARVEERSNAQLAAQAASDKTTRLEAEIAEHRRDEERLTKLRAAAVEHAERVAELEPLAAELAALTAKIDTAGEISAAGETEAVDQAAAKWARLEREHDALVIEIANDEKRAELLARVPCGGDRVFGEKPGTGPLVDRLTPIDCADCELLRDAQAAAGRLGSARALELDLRQRIEAATEAAHTAQAQLDTARAAVESRVQDRARQRELSYVPGRLDEIRAAITANAQEIGKLEGAGDRAVDAAERLEGLTSTRGAREARLSAAVDALAVVDARLAELADVVERAAKLKTAEATEPIVREAMETAERERDTADNDLAALPGHDGAAMEAAGQALIDAEAKVRGETAAHQTRLWALRDAAVVLARVDGRLQEIGDVAAQERELTGRRRQLDSRRGGWVLLERALGRDGIQALEIDAAGPEVSELINELLAACFGPRFTCSLRTVRPAGDGRKQAEVFDLQILDGERGTDARAAGNYSRGEQTLISEALKLALAIFNARRQSVPIRTLWRDECDGPLEPRLAVAYPSMLRRAMELGGYQWVYLISHRPDVYDQADTVINVADGRATVSA